VIVGKAIKRQPDLAQVAGALEAPGARPPVTYNGQEKSCEHRDDCDGAEQLNQSEGEQLRAGPKESHTPILLVAQIMPSDFAGLFIIPDARWREVHAIRVKTTLHNPGLCFARHYPLHAASMWPPHLPLP
jgi:hypothetical protein